MVNLRAGLAPDAFPHVQDILARALEARVRTGEDKTHRFAPHLAARQVLRLRVDDLRKLFAIVQSESLEAPSSKTTSLVESARCSVEESRPSLSTIIAILLCCRADISAWRCLVDAFCHEAEARFNDRHLPFEIAYIRSIFGLTVPEFGQLQFIWCPIVLRKFQQVRYEGQNRFCPLPCLSRKECGRGAFGTVYRVRLAEGHLISEQDRNLDHEYAQKTFLVAKGRRTGFDNEWKAITDILHSRRQHRNIMMPLASLVLEQDELRSTFSIFFPLARCNLWDFLTSKVDEHGACSDFVLLESSDVERRQVFKQAVLLADAIDYLHGGLSTEDHSIACWHLDLKPQNVLVSRTTDEKLLFQISDFGISRIKPLGTHPLAPYQKELDLRVVFERHESPLGASPGGAGGNSECASPESFQQGATLTGSSDVWSYGCILSMLLTFLKLGPNSIETFANLRRHHSGEGDWFFTLTESTATERNDEKSGAIKLDLNRGVRDWFDVLRGARGKGFDHALTLVMDFLLRSVLLIDATKRATAIQVFETLQSIDNTGRTVPPTSGIESLSLENSSLLSSNSGVNLKRTATSELLLSPKHGFDVLHNAIAQGNESRLNELLKSQPGCVLLHNSRSSGRSLVSIAAEYGNLSILQLLISEHAPSVGSSDSQGWTPLLWASWNGHAASVAELLTHVRVEVNHQDDFGRTALFWAAGSGHFDVVQVLLTHSKIDVNLEDKDGRTALTIARDNRYDGISTLLLARSKRDKTERP